MKMIASLSVAFVLCVTSAPVWACTLIGNERFEVDDSLTASELLEPRVVSATIEEFKRGYADPNPGTSSIISSCDNMGLVLLDMGSDQSDVGYDFALSSGELPEGAMLPGTYVTGKVMLIAWIDGRSYVQEEVDFWVTVTPVSRAGVRGPTSDPIHIYDRGRTLDESDEPGCQQVRPAKLPTLPWLVMMCGVIVLGVRRRVRV